MVKVLVLGGTSFVGWAAAVEAVARGHEVSCFHRGITGAPPPGTAQILGDRTNPDDLARLAEQPWDAVIDPSGFVPSVVSIATTALAPVVERYAFVSTISVYADRPGQVVGVGSPVYDTGPEAGPDDGHYGELKAGCERAVLRDLGADRVLMLRPGIILGPRENVGRLPWWLRRIAEGGRVLAPGRADRGMQHIDARDIAVFTLDLLERGTVGTWDLVGPPDVPTWGEWLGECVEVTGSGAELVWVPDYVLVAAGVQEWAELPLWMPGESGAVFSTSDAGAREAGLHVRPWEQTVADTWAWLADGGVATVRDGIGLDGAKEQAILASR